MKKHKQDMANEVPDGRDVVNAGENVPDESIKPRRKARYLCPKCRAARKASADGKYGRDDLHAPRGGIN
jgi:hypothetical protein